MMESPPPLSRYIPQASKKRVFSGSGSTFMEDDVVEIPPPADRSSKLMSQKQKEVSFPEIIDVDHMDEDSADIMLVDKEVDRNVKGKEVLAKFPLGSSSGINPGSGKEVQPSEKNYVSVSEFSIDGDDFGVDLFYGENEVLYDEHAFMDMYYDDIFYDDEYAIVQSHLDSLDIPPGVEVPIPWFTGHQESKMTPVANTSNPFSCPTELDGLGFPQSDSTPSALPLGLEQLPDKSTVGAKSKEIQHPKKWEPSSSRWFENFAPTRKMAAASSSGMKSSNFSPTKYRKYLDQSAQRLGTFPKVPHPAYSMSESSFNKFNYDAHRTMKRFSKGGVTDLVSSKQAKPSHLQTGAAIGKYVLPGLRKSTMGQSFPSSEYKSGPFEASGFMPFVTMSPPFAPETSTGSSPFAPETSTGSSPFAPETSTGSFSGKEKYGVPDEFLKKFELFKRFEVVEDFSDHHYSKNASSVKQAPKIWAKKIQDEWRILENDLPDTIFVRVCESRMDLLRAVIIGAEGTPYHDGLFFFDVFFPGNYPSVPPHVYYFSRGHRINPNLYNCGKVCLSLLNTWSGSHREKWIPGQSTILQVLVSIQGLILNSKPFFNEPGYASMSGSPGGEKSSLQYNENTFILSLKTMVCSIRTPPKYFEDFVAGHFFKHARDILVACKAYIDGAQVGCLVKGGVQDVDEGDTSCSQYFKDNLAGYIKTLVEAFKAIGVKDCDEFLSLAQKTNAKKAHNQANASRVSPYPNYYLYEF